MSDAVHCLWRSITLSAAIVVSIQWLPTTAFANDDPAAAAVHSLIRRYCIDCHNADASEAGVDLTQLRHNDSFARHFRIWRKALSQVASSTMPPGDSAQPSQEQRRLLMSAIKDGLAAAEAKHDGDPGTVVIRRLTSAEYNYTIQDLTGLDLGLDRSFVSDAVGGAGFTNTGLVQFMQDSTLQRYLEAARQVADHAVIGAGPLLFHRDPGPTGLELSAIDRIMQIYREHGFRTAAGEGGEAFGLDRYPQAFFVAWQFHHREKLGHPETSIATLAEQVGADFRFAEFIHGVVTREAPSFPTSDVVAAWKNLPVPNSGNKTELRQVRRQCNDVAAVVHSWQNRFGANADAKEEAPVLRADLFKVTRSQPFEMNINWPKGTKTAHLILTVESANRDGNPDPVVVWRDARIQFRIEDQIVRDPTPLPPSLKPATRQMLRFGNHPRGGRVETNDFVTIGTEPPDFELPLPAGATSARLLVTAELDTKTGEDCIVRCTIAQTEETDQGKSVSGLLANPDGPAFSKWKDGVLEFARLLPQVSQREPAPSDRDPIPAPVDPTYNNPERNHYHTRIKYHRDDQFLVKNILDDETRQRLDTAWADLLGSFEFHDEWLRLIARKYKVELQDLSIEAVDETLLKQLPRDTRDLLRHLQDDYRSIQSSFEAAQSRHLDNVLAFASRAWRRPLLSTEQKALRFFYQSLRNERRLSHRAAIRAMLVRVLVSPKFIYRAERPEAETNANASARLSDRELASRLSHFLWSSLPDDKLNRAAAAGALQKPEQLATQARRMLRDQKARRFATEFFGQWFGFYRFDEHSGIDNERFPEFTDELKSAMHQEAVLFFDHIVRHNRPLNEILFANYGFLDRRLAEHYGIDPGPRPLDGFERIDNVQSSGRGGLLRLGAVLTVTSAPLRTSPVKRGDWILRRVLGSPVPPPPADAGSIPADDVLTDGRSVRERLEAHRRDASCVNCHSRIDALGFALENYDPVGRRRTTYRDGKPIDTSGTLRDGTTLADDKSLHHYLQTNRSRFHRTLSTKLLGYALGRRDQIGDQRLIGRMMQSIEDGSGLPKLVEHIVASRQFRYHGRSTAVAADPVEP